MQEVRLPQKLEIKMQQFLQGLIDTYAEDLVSVSLYGSGASGEFVERYSNLNLLVVLKNSDLENLKKSSCLTRRSRIINPLFLTEGYINSSTDIFPIEFLDMQENYRLLYGKDVLSGLHISTENLRFQCEQELKAKLISLRQSYLRIYKNKALLAALLFKSFNSILHILRNVLRLKGKIVVYQKQEILKEVSAQFGIKCDVFERIRQAKLKQIRLKGGEAEALFIDFIMVLEKIVDIVDKL